ncbi:3-hydroxyacyl-CoA dehydrogenase NAD-binding domain-containing protein [Fusibacter bizertensis]|uniref:3-hydroxyacyl-CoA dehydrogenase NAD-binding domain-containing protein n=1 Tax=Fusibacter bizertensis TaxID=1488331 RepID=A0ABT6N8R1_9FIRM|nr:3-hydroxyacyl-CoA dehydrogenase NAD-binding domain-containing protein [Fusibacter bizertensis]MDH8676799.1 3-hydroxyacyl-CoA dehydrogenase NAD-binding domain-containing protein [Fusibacter bizertensis]
MIKNIAVLGGGTMGHGIAESFALHGYSVNVYEYDETIRTHMMEAIESELTFLYEQSYIDVADIAATLGRIKVFDSMKDATIDADYIIEAVAENIDLKCKIFKELDGYCKAEAIFATNTSSLSLDKMISAVSAERQTKMMVCHWYNPAHLMPIAELSNFGNMPEVIYKEVEQLYLNIDKQVVTILKDVPGLVANRIQQAVAREVFSLIELGVATPEDIDKALKFGPAFRYATTGQLEVADMGGLDIWCIVGDNLLKDMDNRKEANPILRKKVEEGKLGMKSGEGFFKYTDQMRIQCKNDFNKRLITQLKTSKKYI